MTVESTPGAAPIGQIPVKRLDPDIPLPTRAHAGDAGVDLCSTIDVELPPGRRQLVGTGIAVALPFGTVGLIHPRSGLAARAGLSIVNAPGTIDAGYRGEIMVTLLNTDLHTPFRIERGDRNAGTHQTEADHGDGAYRPRLDAVEAGMRAGSTAVLGAGAASSYGAIEAVAPRTAR